MHLYQESDISMRYLRILVVELTSLATRNHRDIYWYILITTAETLNQHKE